MVIRLVVSVLVILPLTHLHVVSAPGGWPLRKAAPWAPLLAGFQFGQWEVFLPHGLPGLVLCL